MIHSTIPEGFTIRPATSEDLEPVLQLITVRNIADYGEPMVSASYLRELWESPKFNLPTDTWLVIAPDGILAAYAELQHQAPAHFYPSIYVAIEHQNSEIGTCLLQLAEASAASRCPDTLPISLTSRVSEQNQAGRHVFEAAGYSLDLSFLIMEIVMIEPPQPPHWAAGITVWTFISGQDEQATYLADEEASQDKGYHQPLTFEAWANRMSLNKNYFDPTLWFLAYSENEIAGVALNFDSKETKTGWIDHLGVRRQWRKKGIGMALLLHSFGEFYRRSIYRVKLSVDSKSLTSAPRLYERAGMRLTQRYHIYSRELILNL